MLNVKINLHISATVNMTVLEAGFLYNTLQLYNNILIPRNLQNSYSCIVLHMLDWSIGQTFCSQAHLFHVHVFSNLIVMTDFPA